MQNLTVLGNLGADATVQTANGQSFLTFKVADTNVYIDKDGAKHENTTWVSCIYAGKYDNILPYLRKGTKVYVVGRPSYRVYSSEKLRCKVAGVDLHVMQIELCGGVRDDVPGQLFDRDGVSHSVSKVFRLSEDGVQLPCQLCDERGRMYQVSDTNVITPIVNG